jgi:hypothetical protein
MGPVVSKRRGGTNSGRVPSLMHPREQHRCTGCWGRYSHALFPGTIAVPSERVSVALSKYDIKHLWDDTHSGSDYWRRGSVTNPRQHAKHNIRSSRPSFVISIPSMYIAPLAGSMIRNKANKVLDFPAPVLPTIPTFACLG